MDARSEAHSLLPLLFLKTLFVHASCIHGNYYNYNISFCPNRAAAEEWMEVAATMHAAS
jgi:hypothetical protein